MKSSPPTPHPHPCLLRGFSTESTSRKTPPEENSMPLPIQRQNSQQKRPTKLLRSPPPSGRPSVTFSLVLEEEIGAAARKEEAEMKEAENDADNGQQIRTQQQENWSMNCCSPTSPPAEGEPRIKLLLFCVSIPLMECARFVGWLATIPIVVSFFLLPFAPSSLVELVPELFLLGTQSICVLALFFGLQHQLPNYLRPFLYFGLFWNLVLLLLLLFSLIELLVSRERFCAQIWLTVYELIYGQMPPTERPRIRLDQLDPFSNLVVQLYQEDQALRRKGAGATAQLPPDSSGFALGLSLCLVSLLALTILVDGWLLNIVLLAYLHMKRNGKGRARDDWYGGGIEEGGGNGTGGNAEQEQELRQALLASAGRKDRQQPSTASRTSSCATSSSLNDDDEDEDNLANELAASSSATCLMTNGTKTMGLENGGFQRNAFENANGNGSRIKWAECFEKVENVAKIEQRRKSEGIEGNFGINGGKESARKFSENGHHHKMGCPHKMSKEKTSNSVYSPLN